MNYLLDTNAVLYFLAGRLARPLPTGAFYLSVISEIELLSYPLLDADNESNIKVFLADIEIIELTQVVKQQAIQLRRAQRLKLPDALIAATAMVLNATLLTNDIQLLKVPGLTAESLSIKPN